MLSDWLPSTQHTRMALIICYNSGANSPDRKCTPFSQGREGTSMTLILGYYF